MGRWSKTPDQDPGFLSAVASPESFFARLLAVCGGGGDSVAEADRIGDGWVESCGRVFRVPLPDLWARDDFSGHTWALRNYRIHDPDRPGADSNVPLEVSRLHLLMPLVKAYRSTGRKKYLDVCATYLASWIEGNPYPLGVNWCNGLDAGVRAMNLLICLAFVGDDLDPRLRARLVRLLWKHAEFIHRQDILYHRKRYPNNHLLGALAGLLALGLAFRGGRAGWFRNTALARLQTEILRQFHQDGGNFESATGYHQFSLEICLVALGFMRAAAADGIGLGAEARDRLARGAALVADYQRVFGRSPNIGDSSDGRVFVFERHFGREPSDHGFLLDMAEVALEPWRRPAGLSNTLYPESGYAFHLGEDYGLAAFAGPKGTEGTGGHGHNDKCSFVLRVGRQPVLVDSGTYIYDTDPAARLEFKRGRAHNIVEVDGQEQCEISQGRLFGLGGDTAARISRAVDGQDVIISMAHDGFVRVTGLGTHVRTLRCSTASVTVEDRLEGSGTHQVTAFFNLHPDVNCRIDRSAALLGWQGGKATMIFPPNFRLDVEDSWYSDRYRRRVAGKRVVARTRASFPENRVTVIRIEHVVSDGMAMPAMRSFVDGHCQNV